MTIVVHGYSTSVTADTNILASNFTSGYKKEDYSIVYLWVTFQNDGVLTLVRKNGATEYDEILNSGCALQANCAYITVLEGKNSQYNIYCIDFELNAANITAGDLAAGRLRRIASTGTEVANEIGVLYFMLEFKTNKVYANWRH